MPYTHEVATTYKTPSGKVQIDEYAFEVEDTGAISVDVPIGAVDLHIQNVKLFMAATPPKTKGFAFAAKKKSGQAPSATTVELEINTNQPSTATPDDTLDITDSGGYSWHEGMPTVNPLSADITDIYVSNNGNAIVTLTILRGNDPTP